MTTLVNRRISCTGRRLSLARRASTRVIGRRRRCGQQLRPATGCVPRTRRVSGPVERRSRCAEDACAVPRETPTRVGRRGRYGVGRRRTCARVFIYFKKKKIFFKLDDSVIRKNRQSIRAGGEKTQRPCRRNGGIECWLKTTCVLCVVRIELALDLFGV